LEESCMTTFTFLRKFTVRFALGLAILAAPKAVLGSEDHEGDPPGHHQDNHDGKHHDGDDSIKIEIDAGTLSELESLLTQFDSISCNATGGTGSAALDVLTGS